MHILFRESRRDGGNDEKEEKRPDRLAVSVPARGRLPAFSGSFCVHGGFACRRGLFGQGDGPGSGVCNGL
jgi:hypothetical protein